jgi:cytochrome c
MSGRPATIKTAGAIATRASSSRMRPKPRQCRPGMTHPVRDLRAPRLAAFRTEVGSNALASGSIADPLVSNEDRCGADIRTRRQPLDACGVFCAVYSWPSERRAMIRVCLAFLMACAWGGASHAKDREHQRAKTMLETMCGRCHAVGATGESPHTDAPPFRIFGENKLYDSDFGRRLQEGLSTIHRDMPTFQFSRRDADAAVNYLRSIQHSRKSKP